MVDWNPRYAFECWQQAEQEARRSSTGDCELGFLYRFEDKKYASLDPYKYEWGNDDEYDIVTKIKLKAIPIRSVTPCGWTIKADNGNGWRFVSKDSTKRYALPTVMEALESYMQRKRRQCAIYRARAAYAVYCMQLARGITFDLVVAKRTLDSLKV